MMEYITIAAVSFFSGLTASLGLGGGFVLLIYLTAFAKMGQMEAQGMNLLFFIPIALLSLILHQKNGMLEKEPVFPAAVTGGIGVLAGVLLADVLGGDLLQKLFAGLIAVIGLKELFHKKQTPPAGKSKQEKPKKPDKR